VDFESKKEGTAAKSAIDLERISVLERRSYLITLYEEYLKKDVFGNRGGTLFDGVRAALMALILQIEGMLLRAKDKKKVEEWKKLIRDGKDTKEIEDLITELNIYLDEIKLTKLDTKRLRDRSDAIENYEAMGEGEDE
jgi:hypothetical protein